MDVVDDAARQPEDFFAGHSDALTVFQRVKAIVDGFGPVEVRTSKSQVAFRRKRGFAYLWMPGRYLKKPGAEVVLSIALGRQHASPRFKQVVHPAPSTWMHHLEIHDIAEIDDEVAGWLAEAAGRAGCAATPSG
ncbi:MAG TPA: DUF5655 domain-containing protein [Acidimicrobiia bacterium]|nr:DUF5655 domain-containing protein [Acidimicrobiia bacterium]